MITGIVVALPEEIKPLSRQKIARGCCVFIGKKIIVAHAGTGPQNAANAVQRLVEKGAERIISWGCAAALNPSLAPGDLILPVSLIGENGQQLSLQSPWRQHLAKYLALPDTTLLESRHLVDSSRMKQRLYRQTQAHALDMESVAVAQTAAEYQRPCLVIRAIADPANMDLPAAIKQAMNDAGYIEKPRLLMHVLTHPGQIPDLIRMGLYFSAAIKTLKVLARQFEALMPGNQFPLQTY